MQSPWPDGMTVHGFVGNVQATALTPTVYFTRRVLPGKRRIGARVVGKVRRDLKRLSIFLDRCKCHGSRLTNNHALGAMIPSLPDCEFRKKCANGTNDN